MRFSTGFPVVFAAVLSAASRSLASPSSRLSTHSLPLYHRVISLSSASPFPAWSKRGVVHVDAHADEAWLDSTEADEGGFEGLGPGERYQLAIAGAGEGSEDLSVVVVDSCVLFHDPKKAFNETLVLYFTPTPTNVFAHLRYYTNAVEGCATPASNDGGWLERGGASKFQIRVERGVEPEPIRWKEVVPIQVGEDGKVIAPPKEKGFLEKYWMYIVPVLLVMLFTGGEEEGAK